jgi:hypothetical protein
MANSIVDTKIHIRTESAAKDDAKPGSKIPRKTRAKSKIWKTKFGSRRVRHDPPTLEEAIVAASGLTDDLAEQIEIAASLMNVPMDEVRAAMKASALSQKYASTVVLARGSRGPRPIVVERRPARRIISDRPAGR